MKNSHNIITLSKGDIVIAPQVENNYLTPQKEYRIKKVFVDNTFVIKDDNEKNLFCKLLNCGHLNGQNWIIKPE